MPVDLHLHSRISDGTDPPERIVDLAVEAGLSALALTDHDTLGGIAAAASRANQRGIRLIPGTELSVDWVNGGAMHMLVYFLEPGSGPLQDRLDWIQQARSARNARMVGLLAGAGVELSLDEVAEEAGGAVVGRPHFAAVMTRKGYTKDLADAFDRFLAQGRPAYLPRERLSAAEAVTLARSSGGVPVIAHPHTLGNSVDEYQAAFAELADHGLGGIEAYYSEYDPELREHLASVATDLGLVATGGSDYHGEYKPNLRVGTGRGDLVVPDRTVADLEDNRRAH